jgi:hypothetical protein
LVFIYCVHRSLTAKVTDQRYNNTPKSFFLVVSSIYAFSEMFQIMVRF